jgi:hypothetical protein
MPSSAAVTLENMACTLLQSKNGIKALLALGIRDVWMEMGD